MSLTRIKWRIQTKHLVSIIFILSLLTIPCLSFSDTPDFPGFPNDDDSRHPFKSASTEFGYIDDCFNCLCINGIENHIYIPCVPGYLCCECCGPKPWNVPWRFQ